MKIRISKLALMNIFFFVTFVILALFRFFYLGGDLGDSALFENIALKGVFPNYTNELLISIQVLIRKFTSNPNNVGILNFPDDSGLSGNLIEAHAYLSFSGIAFLIKLFGFRIFISLVAAGISILPIAIAANLIVRDKLKNGLKDYWIILIILLCYPAVLWSGMGQFYPDRIFIITFPIFLLILDRVSKNPSPKIVRIFILFFILNVTITERASIYVALACGVYSLNTRYNKKLLLVLTSLAIAWSIFYYAYLSSDIYHSSFFDTAKNFSGLHSLLFSTLSLKLLIFHLPGFILIYKMWDLRLTLTIALVPNLLGNIGGAEKIGWVTHYMTYIAATYIGVILIWLQRQISQRESFIKNQQGNFLVVKNRRTLHMQKTYSLITAVTLFIFINPNSRGELIEFNPINNSGIFGRTLVWLGQGQSTVEYKSYKEQVELMLKSIPIQSNIGVSEETSKYVAENFGNLHMFPVNLDILDYIVLKSAGNQSEGYIQSPILNYANPQVGSYITNEAQKLLDGKCFVDLTTPNSLSIYVFKRNWDYNLGQECVSNE